MSSDRIVVVTGAASGIGRGIARKFVQHGAVVVAADRNKETLGVVAQELGERYVPRLCDVTSSEEVATLSDYVRERYPQVDVLVNNAGINRRTTLDKFTDDDFDFHYQVLIKAPMLMAKHFVPMLKESSDGCIINICSIGALVEAPHDANDFLYCTAKAALAKFTKHLVRAYPGIRSHSILPGFVETAISKPHLLALAMPRTPVGRIGRPEDIANLAYFLASEEAGYINGAEIAVDGGFRLYAPDYGF